MVIGSLVSIPYGKGKADLLGAKMYAADYVSIPYGKGKVTKGNKVQFTGFGFQFPMGKVKKSVTRNLLKQTKSINSLWER